jgi:hypothetical protein
MQFIRRIQGFIRQIDIHHTPAGNGDWRSDFTGMLEQLSIAHMAMDEVPKTYRFERKGRHCDTEGLLKNSSIC